MSMMKKAMLVSGLSLLAAMPVQAEEAMTASVSRLSLIHISEPTRPR